MTILNNPEIIQHYYRQSADYGNILYAWFFSMHTRTDIILCGQRSENDFRTVVHDIFQRLCKLENVGNCYDPNSELAQVNRYAAQYPQTISRELYNILAFCIESHARTQGLFDMTIDSSNYNQNTISGVKLSSERPSLFFQNHGIKINLSGFLKGYALDSIRQLLKFHDIQDALVNMGNSSILAVGKHPCTEGWEIGFEKNFASSQQSTILLKDECLTISGNHSPERKHIIIPSSGKWVEGKGAVSVVTTSGAVGEVLSTALFAADLSQWKALEEEFCPRLTIKLS